MSVVRKLEAFLTGLFVPAAQPAAASDTPMARHMSRQMGEQAASYSSMHGDRDFFRHIQDSCRDLIAHDEFNIDCFRDGYRTRSGREYPFDADVESNDVFGLEAMLMKRAHVRYAQNPGGFNFRQ